MKLHELKRGDFFRIISDNRFPPAHRSVPADEVYKFSHIDGMYSLCYLRDGAMTHPVAWAEVEQVAGWLEIGVLNPMEHEQSK
jgi:hypothetical protein